MFNHAPPSVVAEALHVWSLNHHAAFAATPTNIALQVAITFGFISISNG